MPRENKGFTKRVFLAVLCLQVRAHRKNHVNFILDFSPRCLRSMFSMSIDFVNSSIIVEIIKYNDRESSRFILFCFFHVPSECIHKHIMSLVSEWVRTHYHFYLTAFTGSPLIHTKCLLKLIIKFYSYPINFEENMITNIFVNYEISTKCNRKIKRPFQHWF